MAQRACIDSHDYTECALALGYCTEMLEGTFFNAGVNP
jgi:cathepsin A (carboxypeptidase C)